MVDLKTNLFFFLSETSSEKYCLEMEQNYFQFFKNKFIRTLKKAKSNFFYYYFLLFTILFFFFASLVQLKRNRNISWQTPVLPYDSQG